MTHLLEISPEAAAKSDRTDFFGTMATTCTHADQHAEMAIRLACHVEMLQPAPWQDCSPPVAALRKEWGDVTDLSAHAPLHFLGPAPRLAPDPAITAFATSVFDSGATAATNAITFGRALHDVMTFDAAATNVDTDASEAFRLKRGVCQDLSHIMILGLQAMGIPAAYVSGYLRTLPPVGGVKLEGADAMHAWVRVWCGAQQGWIEYDPTNATLVGTDHIVVGYGRDYSDIAPVNGHLRSSGGQRSSQAVDVKLVQA